MNNLIELSNFNYNKALELARTNRITLAVNFIEKSLKYYSKDIQVLNLMGMCHYKLCNFDKAYSYWSKSFALEDENNKAKEYLLQLKSIDFSKFVEKYNLAINNVKNLRYKKAINLLNEITQLDKEFIEPYIITGLCYYEINEYELAKENIIKALELDKDNMKCLKYLNKINYKCTLHEKSNNNKMNKVLQVSILLIILTSGIVFYQKHSNYIEISELARQYKENLKEITLDLEKSEKEYSDLKVAYENEKNKNEVLNIEGNLGDEIVINNNSFIGSELEAFESAIIYFRNEEYDKAIDIFKYVISNGIEEYLVAESTYFIAVAYEKNNDYVEASRFYCSYIDNFNERNYYDDTLYNYGIILYKQGNKEEAKNILDKLLKDVPNSIFINSKVKYILNS